MQITLKQADIETAISEYVAKMGIPPVASVTFNTSRKGGFAISADVEIADRVQSDGPIPRSAVSEQSEPVAEKVAPPVEETKPAAKVAPKEPEAKPRAVKAKPEPVKEEAKEVSPFEPDSSVDAVNDSEQPAAEPKKSLFG